MPAGKIAEGLTTFSPLVTQSLIGCQSFWRIAIVRAFIFGGKGMICVGYVEYDYGKIRLLDIS